MVTKFGNVPINNKIRSWNPSTPPTDYLTMLYRWDTYHDIRTAAPVLAFPLVIVTTARMIGTSTRRPARASKSAVAL
ncbi:DUF1772 domain-containing protein [Nocardia sp. NPDC046763]|uniref:DUF1772 domain-containing protein n=1 Tax=Nocardia sp. NPDC046763 TaxID=3155256 RepID=UPI00340F3D1F